MKLKTLICVLFFAACGTTKKTSILQVSTPLAPDATVEVLGAGQKIPDGAKLLGQIKIGDSGVSVKCSYDKVIADAQSQSRAMGGNIMQITWHKEPDMLSTCHRIKADIYLLKK